MFVMTLCTITRCICFLSTGLPGPAPHCLPSSKEYNPPITMHQILWRKEIFKGCGDLIFSSHTAVSMIFILAIKDYLKLFLPRNKYLIILYGIYWPLLVLQILFIIASRKHYTVDIIVALYTTPFLWNLSWRLLSDCETEVTLLYKSLCIDKKGLDLLSTKSMVDIKIKGNNHKHRNGFITKKSSCSSSTLL